MKTQMAQKIIQSDVWHPMSFRCLVQYLLIAIGHEMHFLSGIPYSSLCNVQGGFYSTKLSSLLNLSSTSASHFSKGDVPSHRQGAPLCPRGILPVSQSILFLIGHL
jgi:hypothetical protein